MRLRCALAALLMCVPHWAGAQSAAPVIKHAPWPAPAGSTPLWDGHDLVGWTVYFRDGAPAEQPFWSAAGGILHFAGKPTGYVRTEKVFSNYHLHAEWRWPGEPKAGKNNSGIFVMQHAPDVIWPYSVQVQTKEGFAGDLISQGGLLFPAGDTNPTIKKLAAPSEAPTGRWNAADIYCRGASVEVFVNGVRQNYVDKLPTDSGQIALQIEGYAVDFANIWIEPLGTATGPKLGMTPVDWSERMANSEMARLGTKLDGDSKNAGRWDYTTGMYADSLIRLTERTGNPAYEKCADRIIGSFISPFGGIATYQAKHRRGPKKPKGKASQSPSPGKNKKASKSPSPGPKKKPSPTPAKKASPSPAKKAKPSPSPKKFKGVPYSLDEVESGVATLKLYDITHEARYRLAADILRRQLQRHPRTKEGGFFHKAYYPEQMWLDGLYMGEPFYAAYAERFNEPEDFNDIARQFALVGKHTYDPKTGLFYHGWDAVKKQPWANRVTGASPSFWSRAIGWYAMGLVDVLATMPADNPNRPVLLYWFHKVADGLLNYQDPRSGLWWQVTDKGRRKHNYLEATASCMFVYSLAKGVNLGYLPHRDVPAVRAGYEGIVHRFITVDKHGEVNLTHCCQVAGLDGKYKGSFDYYTRHTAVVSNDLKGVAPFINAGMECDQLFHGQSFVR